MKETRCTKCGAKMSPYYPSRRKNPQYTGLCRSCWRTSRSGSLKEERRQLIASAKRKPCTDCGVSYPPYVIQFDHRPGETKLFALADWQNLTHDQLVAELAKCDVVCANCHCERTQQRRYKYRFSDSEIAAICELIELDVPLRQVSIEIGVPQGALRRVLREVAV